MAREVELKLNLPEHEQRRFLRNSLLHDASGRDNGRRISGRLVNIYYDTPDLALHSNGIALRLRKSRGSWLQTVKCAGISHTGLSMRPEWETLYEGKFDFSSVDHPDTCDLLERFQHRLVPVFETNFLRTEWKVEEAGTALIVALDRGVVVADGKSATISEVEIEIDQGEVDAIFSLTDRLMQQFTLTPGQCSKAERGYGLFVGKPEKPSAALPIRLDRSMTPRAAFRHIAHACLDHLQQNQPGAVHSDDAEYIHQMRVAMRRLRAAIRLFKPVLPDAFSHQLLPPLRELTAILGTARDLDVLISEIIDPVVSAIPAEPRITTLAGIVAERRHAARQATVNALSAAGYGRLLLLAMRELHGLIEEHDGSAQEVADFAHARLKQLRHKLMHRIRSARQEDPASLHILRIGAKRLRYGLEFFSSLLLPRRSTRLIKHLGRLQDCLGQLNDLANAGVVLMDCAGDEPKLHEAVSLIGGWHGQRHAELLSQFPRALKKLHRAHLPKAE